MDTLFQDLKYALRLLWQSRGVSAIALLTLALGVGGNTAVFTVVRGVLIRPLPYVEPSRLVSVLGHLPGLGSPTTGLTEVELSDLSSHPEVFAQVAAYIAWAPTLTGGEAERLRGSLVSSSLLRTLGARVEAGRDFISSDEAPGAAQVVLVTHSLWKRRFSADPSLLGRTVTLNGKLETVVGILPEGFRHPLDLSAAEPVEILSVLPLNPAHPKPGRGLETVARLSPGADPKRAAGFLDVLARRLAAADPRAYPPGAQVSLSLLPFRQRVVGDSAAGLWILLGAVALVLLIACANVANLLLARAEGRRREMAVRLALGASPGRLLRQLLTESLLFATLGGLAGLAVSQWALAGMLALAPGSLPRLGDIFLDGPVLFFTAAISLATGVIFGLAPALRLGGHDLHETLQHGAGAVGMSRRQGRFSRALVSAEMALAVTVLIGAGLLLKSFWRLSHTETGFRGGNVLTVHLTLPATTYPDGERVWRTYQSLVSRLETLPGVEKAAGAEPLPFSGNNFDVVFQVEGRPRDAARDISAELKFATAGYFDLVGLQAVRGRALRGDDNLPQAPPVVAINETLARRAFPGEQPIGKRLRLVTSPDAKNAAAEIVGVLSDAKNTSLAGETRPEIYIPHVQAKPLLGLEMRWMTLLLRTRGSAAALVPAVRAEVRALDTDLVVSDVHTFEDVVAREVAAPKFNLLLIGVFALMALALGVIGIYGVTSIWVARRTRELGVRMALGAGRPRVLGLVVRQGMSMLLAGVVAGVLLSAALAGFLSSMLYQVSAFDLPTFAGCAALLLVAGLAAVLLPARRATRVDPAVALRAE